MAYVKKGTYTRTCTKSNYVGKTFENWKVIDKYIAKKYNQYPNEISKYAKYGHRAYHFVLENQETGEKLTLSGYAMLNLKKGKRTIEQMFNSSAKCSRNKQIREYMMQNKKLNKQTV